MQIIKVTSVSKSFRGREVLTSANASFDKGSITALVGANGSGKSLLFRMICGFVTPDSGEIWVDPSYLSKGRDYPEKFGISIDRPGFIAHLTGFANLEMLANIRRTIGASEITQIMLDFGLDPKLKQKVRHYSLGMKQKLALAQAFMESPEVLILDEPFNALDEESVETVRNRIRVFNQNGGTVIFTSHNSDDVRQLASKVYGLRNGCLELLP
jgi:ABC-2 type transport system ATP-binding protein